MLLSRRYTSVTFTTVDLKRLLIGVTTHVTLFIMLTKTDLKQIDTIVTIRINNAVKPIKQDTVQIRKDIKIIVSFFDREYLELRKRVERIEERLHLPPLS